MLSVSGMAARQPSNFPSKCACGASFSVDHALCCSKVGFPTHRHNEICDFTVSVLTEVCHDVCTEPPLQELAGEPLPYATSNREDGARLDIRAQGFWGDRFRRAFFDIRVFYPNASSYRNLQLSSIYSRHEKEKKRNYEDSTSGGMGGLATTTYKRLASQIATKKDQPYSKVIAWLRCHLWSSITAIRGARSSVGHATMSIPAVDLAVHVGCVPST